jgi:RNA polymerase sigma-70 factor (ECF subfamily)
MSTPLTTAQRRGDDATSRDSAQEISWLYERYRDEVFHLALRYSYGNTAWAEDVVHDVFVQLMHVRPNLRDRELLSSWFYRVTTNRCLNKLRHESMQRSPLFRWFFGRQEADERTPERIATMRSELTKASSALQELPVKQRLAFYMHYVDGIEQAEIGRVLRHSKGYVSKLLNRAKAQLAARGWKVES